MGNDSSKKALMPPPSAPIKEIIHPSNVSVTYSSNEQQLQDKLTENINIVNSNKKGPKTNEVARQIVDEMSKHGEVSDNNIKIALAYQQSLKKGPLTKLDYIAILIRLNPTKDNALISQYKVSELIDMIRHELYTKQINK